MRLPFLRSKDPAAERSRAAAGPADSTTVEAARTRARQRLVGALVLLAVGVVGFPMLFETQPRPLPVDTPMEVARGDGGSLPRPAPVAPAAEPRPLALPPADAGVEVAPAASAPAALVAPAMPASAAAAPTLPAVAAAAPIVVREPAARASAPRAPAARASAPRAAAPTPAPAPPAVGRFVVQAGAYTDAAALRDARVKVEKLGLKTYTQVIEGDAGKRTRLRVGPFTTRQEADGVAARIKGAGLPTAVLAL